MASEYKKRGGSYNTDKKDQDESQKHLSQWTEEEWQTKEGSGNAKQADGNQKCYLPKKAWEDMTEGQQQATDEKKLEGSKEGKQFVGNTGRAKSARQKANREERENMEAKKAEEKKDEEPKSRKNTTKKSTKNTDEHDDNPESSGEHPATNNKANTGQKRGRPKSTDKEPPSKKSKTSDSDPKSKTIGSKHDSADAPAEQASADRLPKKGQTVHWKALPGWVEGTCVEIVRENKEVEGKSVKAKRDDPRIVMKSKNGKIAVHKPEAVYFD